MAYNDLPLIDHLKCHHGDSDMSDERLAAVGDDWFLKASPLERQQTLISIKATLDEQSDSTTLRQKVPLLQLNRRLSAIEANLKRLGRYVLSPMNSPKRNSASKSLHGIEAKLNYEKLARSRAEPIRPDDTGQVWPF